jgi:chemotaxis response regulator CheB
VGDTPNSGQRIVVVGASAGGVDALTEFVRGLPGDQPAAIETGAVDRVLSLGEIPEAILGMTAVGEPR